MEHPENESRGCGVSGDGSARTSIDAALAAWDGRRATSLTVAMLADALCGAREQIENLEATIARVEALTLRLVDPLNPMAESARRLPASGAWRRGRWVAAQEVRAALRGEQVERPGGDDA